MAQLASTSRRRRDGGQRGSLGELTASGRFCRPRHRGRRRPAPLNAPARGAPDPRPPGDDGQLHRRLRDVGAVRRQHATVALRGERRNHPPRRPVALVAAGLRRARAAGEGAEIGARALEHAATTVRDDGWRPGRPATTSSSWRRGCTTDGAHRSPEPSCATSPPPSAQPSPATSSASAPRSSHGDRPLLSPRLRLTRLRFGGLRGIDVASLGSTPPTSMDVLRTGADGPARHARPRLGPQPAMPSSGAPIVRAPLERAGRGRPRPDRLWLEATPRSAQVAVPVPAPARGRLAGAVELRR